MKTAFLISLALVGYSTIQAGIALGGEVPASPAVYSRAAQTASVTTAEYRPIQTTATTQLVNWYRPYYGYAYRPYYAPYYTYRPYVYRPYVYRPNVYGPYAYPYAYRSYYRPYYYAPGPYVGGGIYYGRPGVYFRYRW